MSESTRLLLRTYRSCFVLVGAILFVLALFAGRSDFPVEGVVPIALVLALVLSLSFLWHTDMRTCVFPVTDRQTAWLPMGIAGALWGVALVGVVVGQVWGAVLGDGPGLVPLALEWWKALPLLPFAICCALLTLRLMRIGSLLPFVCIFFLLSNNREVKKALLDPDLFRVWPVWLAVAAFLIWEAPAWAGMFRRLEGQETIARNGAIRPKLRTRVLDALILACVLYAATPLIREGGEAIEYMTRFSKENDSLLVYLWLLVFLVPLALGGLLCRLFWRQHRASGLGVVGSLLLIAMRFTVVLCPFVRLLGVRRGAMTRCPACGRDKFVWQVDCPFCVESTIGLAAGRPRRRLFEEMWTAMEKAWVAMMSSQHDPEARNYRIDIPFWILCVSLFCRFVLN